MFTNVHQDSYLLKRKRDDLSFFMKKHILESVGFSKNLKKINEGGSLIDGTNCKGNVIVPGNVIAWLLWEMHFPKGE